MIAKRNAENPPAETDSLEPTIKNHHAFALLLFGLFVLSGCGQSAATRCPAGYEDLTSWTISPRDAPNLVTVHSDCPSQATIRLGATSTAYLKRVIPVQPGAQVGITVAFRTDCLPDDGMQEVAINENGIGVATTKDHLATTSLGTNWVPTANMLELIVRAQSAQPCDIAVALVVAL